MEKSEFDFLFLIGMGPVVFLVTSMKFYPLGEEEEREGERGREIGRRREEQKRKRGRKYDFGKHERFY